MVDKYKIFKCIHDYPIELYILWLIPVCLGIVLLLYIYFGLTDYSETYQFVMSL